MDPTQDFKSLQDSIQSALISTTRTAGQVASEDLGFHRSFNKEVGTALDEQSQRLLSLASALLKSAASIAEFRAPVLEDTDDVENNWRSVVDVVDSLLEKSDTCLDEYTGVIKRKEPTTNEQSSQTAPKSKKLGLAYRTQNLVKPQLAFNVKPNNDDVSPWKPILTTKPHAIILLENALGTIVDDTNQAQYRHPYETEILNLEYPKAVYQQAEPIPYLPVDTTSATFVNTEEGVMEMLKELRDATEIAIDLEHHDTRSYVGLVSLMQISTRHKDWIVDTLRPWRQNLQVLNDVFADPKIIKVFHGAYMDIVWLQRDLGLYIVGMFDTHWASRSLGYAGGSLAFLLKKFINFDADKKYQLADWRIRPLPEEMFFYARADTHFLLYIYDCMRNELVEKTNPEIPEENLIEIVLQKSKETSLLRYERQVYNEESGRGPGGWYSLLTKTPALLNNEQFAVFKAVHGWRDRIARTDDDNPSFVMPTHVVTSLAKLMPMDMVALLGIAHPVSHSVKSRAGELLDLIKSAKARGKTGPSMMDSLRPELRGAVEQADLRAAAAAENTPKGMVAVVDEGELRSDNSAFWGGAFGSSIWDGPTLTHNDKLTLAVPLPALSSEAFATSNESVNPATPMEEAAKEPTPPSKQESQAEEPFVLKRGGKRKSDVISDAEKSDGDDDFDISFKDMEEDDKEAREAQRKAAKRAKKEAKKAAKAKAEAEAEAAGKASASDEDDDDKPFDYSNADSVLNAKRKAEDNKGGSKKKQKPFDPYSKSADAPKGMRRQQTERAGKSHTFKK
ncbi:related to nucleolar 100K polymyositis-scleroderma protein [Phialocephala subalpina]|uniref:Related to nucleolar 100K polymyositis-scleroderma protein n=1 Tax=Phialocephala subalpina TaxID=576137 RepID=A0A1L7WXG9_9HELO|nr:related to nucleolar 100K polymyositis-scleroderma protein [Phialocephala subalpina]